MERIIIIGGGIAGLTAAENIRKNKPDADIVIISDEEYLPYSRIKIGKFIYSSFKAEDILLHPEKWYEDNRIKVMLSTKAVKIYAESNTIELDSGEKMEYSSLVLANGSRSFIPPIPGSLKRGVFSVRNIKDIMAIQKYIDEFDSVNIAVIGGGVLGLESAWSLKSGGKNFNINIIEAAPRLLPRQMDEEGSLVIEGLLNQNSIGLYKGVSVKEIFGDGRVRHIELSGGSSIPADLVIISAGIRSNIDIARDAGIKTNKGIIVDRNMRTNFSSIYAAGDSAEYNGMTWGIWPVALEQGAVASMNASGIKTDYKEVVPSNFIQVMGVNVFSTGEISGEGLEEVKYGSGIYTKIFHRKGILCGAILVGDTHKGFAVKKAIEQARDFSKEIAAGTDLLQII